ncbi:MAG: hypothetical protein MRY74_08290 [Neomegalonema sp.]|nr:hypothetical protein [Neomegalonema sp.]
MPATPQLDEFTTLMEKALDTIWPQLSTEEQDRALSALEELASELATIADDDPGEQMRALFNAKSVFNDIEPFCDAQGADRNKYIRETDEQKDEPPISAVVPRINGLIERMREKKKEQSQRS